MSGKQIPGQNGMPLTTDLPSTKRKAEEESGVHGQCNFDFKLNRPIRLSLTDKSKPKPELAAKQPENDLGRQRSRSLVKLRKSANNSRKFSSDPEAVALFTNQAGMGALLRFGARPANGRASRAPRSRQFELMLQSKSAV